MSETLTKSKKRRKVPLDIIIHVLCYVLVNTGLFFLNQMNTSYFWFMWVITGWGIGLFLHIVARFVARLGWRGSTKGLVLHWLLYSIMTMYFLFIDSYTGQNFSNPITWAYYPITAWFSLVFAHSLSFIFLQIRIPPEDRRARIRYYLINSFIVHMFVFLCANAYMLIVNSVTGYETKWHLWPLAGTALALSIHIFVTIIESVKVKNTQLKVLLYHVYLFIVISGYIIFEDRFSGTLSWWYWPVGGWSLGILLHLIYYFIRIVGKKKHK